MYRVFASNHFSDVEEPEAFSDHIEMYISGGYSLDEILDQEDLDFIFDSTESTTASLFRVEDARFTSKNKNLKVGDKFSFKGKYGLRSFTRNIKVSQSMLDEMSDDYAGISNPVLFKTTGRVEQFSMDDYANGYTVSNQEESLAGGTWQVLRIDKQKFANQMIDFYIIKQVNPFGTI